MTGVACVRPAVCPVPIRETADLPGALPLAATIDTIEKLTDRAEPGAEWRALQDSDADAIVFVA